MARGLKDLGLDEVRALKRRVNRQKAMERIWPADAKELTDLLDQVEAKIVAMPEAEEGETI